MWCCVLHGVWHCCVEVQCHTTFDVLNKTEKGEGFRRRTLASNLGPPQNPTTWTTRDRVPYAPKYSQATPRQKYIWVNFPINCRVARWPRGLSDVHWPQICDLPKIPPRGRRGIKFRTRRNIYGLFLNKHTSLGRLGSAALVGSQSRRRTTPI